MSTPDDIAPDARRARPSAAAAAPCGPGRPRAFDEDAALAAALEVFWTRGFEAASLEELTRAMGLSRSSFYAWLGSKRGALVAAIESYARGRRAALEQILRDAPDARAAAIALAEALAPRAAQAKGCFMVNCLTELAPADPEVAAIGRAHMRALEDLAERTLAAVEPARARERASALVALSLGAATLGKAGAPARTLRAIAQEARRLAAPPAAADRPGAEAEGPPSPSSG
ncbi:TetR/AcrR family transcriptional regulator [Oceanicella actignis]|uniref:Transcriptional regulator, TetR family n=1 Tax=Oceanicella actignis TaxID=1189325 RepID=A0A1M7U369_9RHOB|nr:TetR/AcrR family transcriptional regulator [Oceanicella actignis]TYO84987.1 TetR family transcriptional regulator [Oceanicella actignis]SET86471.1 transcriptional regulator, TetR family [Oceanicella actignis]SHN77300.1 transcriptional regulator, TetR family [Oceanicella actignis]